MFKLGLNKSANFMLLKNTAASKSLFLNRSIVNKRLFSISKSARNKITTQAEDTLLSKQRGNRPISPHLTIYQPQLTWYLSSLHRLTAVFLGATFYVVTISFGLSALLGLGLTADNLSNWYHNKFSPTSQSVIKALYSYMFALQFTLSVRHFVWDMGKELSLKGVYRTGYGALALSAVLGTYLWW
ncbi:hypothetical protein TPHA_0G02790 [Tetrapisispora phaffii CBS 4417]|uniref:Uncharacterized protein n=1 Tax=Tetrapisispora phaffii (strain ATCC 24235 / CBS 4417 / NBRC 1672 / NRRL Y-8282 / UCD 70-5) TaxID=1071381 RepID=G8BW39_TETPH|nr:hypothetical protein TPHA_0G02790 [Tetrapisispora phaffii CBS 4417]CCE64117.1 hypothetical protein TPHA_0G02790 [Tetrapisispora phaffii CBS 4417]